MSCDKQKMGTNWLDVDHAEQDRELVQAGHTFVPNRTTSNPQ